MASGTQQQERCWDAGRFECELWLDNRITPMLNPDVDHWTVIVQENGSLLSPMHSLGIERHVCNLLLSGLEKLMFRT